MLLVELRERADAAGREELVLVEHLGEDPAEPLRVHQGQDSPLGNAKVCRPGRVDGLQELGHAA